MMRSGFRGMVCVVGALCALVLGGCGSYELKGRVVRGDVSWAGVVDKDDPRLQEAGVAGVQISLVTDPMKINRERVSGSLSDNAGDFALPVDEPGAGFLIYDVGAYASKPGYLDAEGFFRLPSKDKRLLIVMHPGQSQNRAGTVGRESLYDQYEEAEKKWR